ncbi:MAG: enolase C-terminal domain-like protein [Pseudomonadota bacterium]
MTLQSIQAFSLAIPFTAAFKHASAERAVTQTIWVEIHSQNGVVGFGEGCPREYVTSESLDSSRAFIVKHRQDWLNKIHDVRTLVDWSERHRADIDNNQAAWTAVEIACLDLFGKEANKSVESLLDLPELSGVFRYTAVLGDAPSAKFDAQLAKYLQAGFQDFKIKLSGHEAQDITKAKLLSAAGVSPGHVRADANNLWRDSNEAIRHLMALDFPFFALEEPLHAGDDQGMARIATTLDTKIVLDESLVRAEQLKTFADASDRWIINLRLSKMGGLLRSLAFLDEARRYGMQIIIGAHVGETSLLTRAALTVASSASDILVAQEGAFGTHLLTKDVVDSPLMFAGGGLLDVTKQKIIDRQGFGLKIVQPMLYLTSFEAM